MLLALPLDSDHQAFKLHGMTKNSRGDKGKQGRAWGLGLDLGDNFFAEPALRGAGRRALCQSRARLQACDEPISVTPGPSEATLIMSGWTFGTWFDTASLHMMGKAQPGMR
jgi:hypothetical protein